MSKKGGREGGRMEERQAGLGGGEMGWDWDIAASEKKRRRRRMLSKPPSASERVAKYEKV